MKNEKALSGHVDPMMATPNKLNLKYLLNDEIEDARKKEDEIHVEHGLRRHRRQEYPIGSASMPSISLGEYGCQGSRNQYSSEQDRSMHLGSPSMRNLFPISSGLVLGGLENNPTPHNTDGSNSRRGQNRNFRCEICGKSFFERGNLNKHVSSVHLKEKPKVCPEPGCGKSFSFRDGLMRHIAHVHKNQRLHVCHLCQKSFKQASHLGKHMRTIHKTS